MHVRRHLLLVSVVQPRGAGPLGGELDDQVEGGGRDLRRARPDREGRGTGRRSPLVDRPAGLARCFAGGWTSRACSGLRGIAGIAAKSASDGGTSSAIALAAPATAGLSRTSLVAEALSTPSEPPIRFMVSLAQIASRIFGVTVTSSPPAVSSEARGSSRRRVGRRAARRSVGYARSPHESPRARSRCRRCRRPRPRHALGRWPTAPVGVEPSQLSAVEGPPWAWKYHQGMPFPTKITRPSWEQGADASAMPVGPGL